MTHIGLPTGVYWKNLEFYNLKRLTGKDRIIAQDKDHIDGDYRNYYFHPIVVVPVDYDLEKDFTYLYKSWPYEFTSFTDVWEKEVNVEMSSIYVPIGEEKKRKKEKEYYSYKTYYGIPEETQVNVDGFSIQENIVSLRQIRAEFIMIMNTLSVR